MATTQVRTNADYWMDTLEATGIFTVNRDVAAGLFQGKHGVYAVQRGDDTAIAAYVGVRAFDHNKRILSALALLLKEWVGISPRWGTIGEGYNCLLISSEDTSKAIRHFGRTTPAESAPVPLVLPTTAVVQAEQEVRNALFQAIIDAVDLLGTRNLYVSYRAETARLNLQRAYEDARLKLREAGADA